MHVLKNPQTNKPKTHKQYIKYGYIFHFYADYRVSDRHFLVVVSNLGIYKYTRHQLQESRDHIYLAQEWHTQHT